MSRKLSRPSRLATMPALRHAGAGSVRGGVGTSLFCCVAVVADNCAHGGEIRMLSQRESSSAVAFVESVCGEA